jgi:hypothetical protein
MLSQSTLFAEDGSPKNKRCSFPSCGRPTWAKRHCGPHYRQLMRGEILHPLVRGDIIIDGRILSPVRKEGKGSGRVTTFIEEATGQIFRACGSCKAMIAIEEFALNVCDIHHGRHWKCRKCVFEFVRSNQFYLKKYGISKVEYARILASQNGVCAICCKKPGWAKKSERRLAVDHDHATGAVRGLLCFLCNGMLGKAKDKIRTLKRAIAYLEKHNVQPRPVAQDDSQGSGKKPSHEARGAKGRKRRPKDPKGTDGDFQEGLPSLD